MTHDGRLKKYKIVLMFSKQPNDAGCERKVRKTDMPCPRLHCLCAPQTVGQLCQPDNGPHPLAPAVNALRIRPADPIGFLLLKRGDSNIQRDGRENLTDTLNICSATLNIMGEKR